MYHYLDGKSFSDMYLAKHIPARQILKAPPRAFYVKKQHKKPLFIHRDKRFERPSYASRSIVSWWSQIWSPDSSKFRKIIWVGLVLTVTTLWLYQVGHQIMHFIVDPPLVRVEFVNNDTLVLPTVIICPEPMSKNKNLHQLIKEKLPNNTQNTDFHLLVDAMNISVDELWEKSEHEVTKNLDCSIVEGIDIQHEERSRKHIRSSNFNTPSGVCQIIRTNDVINYRGSHTYLHITSNHEDPQPGYYQVYIIEDNELTSAHYDTTIQGYIFKPSEKNSLALRLLELTFLDRWKEPCVDDKEHAKCWKYCIENEVLKAAGQKCRLPFMRKHSGLRTCKTSEELYSILTATNQVIEDIHYNSQCKCKRQCTKIVYQKNYSVVRYQNETLIDLYIYFSYNSIMHVREYDENSYVEALSSFGGTMGLYLGICLLTLLEIVEDRMLWFWYFWKRCSV